MRNIFRVSYYIRSNFKNRQGLSPIVIRIYLNSEMLVIGSTGLSVDAEKWDGKNNRVKGKTADTLTAKLKLEQITSSLNEIFKRLEYEDAENISLEKIKNIYLNKEEKTDTFLELFSNFNKDIQSLIGKTKNKSHLSKIRSYT